MITFETVSVLVKGGEGPNEKQFICVRDSLFDLLWALNHSEHVLEFIVNQGTQTNKDFRWGPISKWVTSFSKEHFKSPRD